jgi:hypothetical protein
MTVLLALNLDKITKPFKEVLDQIIASLLRFLGFIGYVFVSWLIIKFFVWIVRKVLSKIKIDEWFEKLSETEIFGDTSINVVLTKVILGVVKWFLILIFVISGSSIFGLDTVFNAISSFLA